MVTNEEKAWNEYSAWLGSHLALSQDTEEAAFWARVISMVFDANNHFNNFVERLSSTTAWWQNDETSKRYKGYTDERIEAIRTKLSGLVDEYDIDIAGALNDHAENIQTAVDMLNMSAEKSSKIEGAIEEALELMKKSGGQVTPEIIETLKDAGLRELGDVANAMAESDGEEDDLRSKRTKIATMGVQEIVKAVIEAGKETEEFDFPSDMRLIWPDGMGIGMGIAATQLKPNGPKPKNRIKDHL